MRIRLLFLCALSLAFCSTQAQKGFSLAVRQTEKKVDVLYDGKLLTSYCHFDSTEKPVLFPIRTLSGVTITRGYPIVPRPGERTDHPHHVGLWMNYESVNGLDFWNNSTAIDPEKKSHYGSIRHQTIASSNSKKDEASIEALSSWVNHEGQTLLEEKTLYVFTRKDNDFIIDRIATLNSKVSEVVFKDVKDGMLGLRVARELELPSRERSKFVDLHGNVTEVPLMSNEAVTGMYYNREGIKGDAVWSTRSTWVYLQGKKDGQPVAIAIIDHPRNIGYPTYWHARGYGLFAANPLGQKVFSNGKEEMNFTLKPGAPVTFRYRVVIRGGSDFTSKDVDQLAEAFALKK